MENDIAMIAAGYVFARLGLLALFGYVIYRILTASTTRVPARLRSHYARERLQATRNQR
jgi:hypothetical protein